MLEITLSGSDKLLIDRSVELFGGDIPGTIRPLV